MAQFAIPLMIASAAVSAVGSLSAASAQAASYRSQETAANYNATVEKQNANAALAASSANELQQRQQNDQRMGIERARVAESAGGFTGTNVGVLSQNAANLELSALNTRYGGAMQARNFLTQSSLDQYQASVARSNAKRASDSGWIGALGGALGTVANYSNARALYTGSGW